MSRDINFYKQTRQAIIGRVTFFKEKVEQNEDSLANGELNSILGRLKILYVKFDDAQSEIELLDEDEFASNIRHEFEELYGVIESKILCFLNPSIDNSSFATIVDNEPTPTKPFHSILPTPQIELPKFDGNFASWINFRLIYNELVHCNENITPLIKFHYLRSCLDKGKAYHFIDGIPATPANYHQVWDSLYKYFENDTRIKFLHMGELYNLKPVKQENNAFALQVFIDAFLKQYNALKALDIPVQEWDLYLVYHISNLVDPQSQKQIELAKTSDKIPNVPEVIEILSRRARLLEAMSKSNRVVSNMRPNSNVVSSKPRPEKSSQSFVTVESEKSCLYCKGKHLVYSCDQFINLSWVEKNDWVTKNYLCRKCFGKHLTNKCVNRDCRICRYPHNSLLHRPKEVVKATDTLSQPSEEVVITATTPNPSASSKALCLVAQSPQVLLSTAIIWVRNAADSRVPCRALIDSASESNFITENMCQTLRAKKYSSNRVVNGIGESVTNSQYTVQLNIESRLSDYKKTLDCLVLPNITGQLPSSYISFNKSEFSQSQLSDPSFYKPNKIDMLLGAEVYSEVMLGEKVILSSELPPFMDSSLGYIACGKVPTHSVSPSHSKSFVCSNIDDLSEQIQQFWHIENLSTLNNFSLEEKACESHYANNVQRLDNGKYCVALPTKPNISSLSSSEQSALRQFYSLENRLTKNPTLYDEYRNFMNEYIQLNHMSKVEPNSDGSASSFFLPHHAVVKESSSTTKLRVVFNASAKSRSGVSLNEVLMTGPTIQPDLFTHLVQFRLPTFVLTADIAKMYRQVLVRASDRNLQQIFWRNSAEEPVSIFQLNTVTYGTASAPFLAIRTLKQLAIDEYQTFPEAAAILTKNFYVDDLLIGSDDRNHAFKLKHDLMALLKLGGLELRKWRSNDAEIVSDGENFENILGVPWDSKNDVFEFHFNKVSVQLPLTKRAILAQITRFFDPIGLANPVIFKAKLFMQSLWAMSNLGWDDSIPVSDCSEWMSFAKDLNSTDPIRIPRWVKNSSQPTRLELHGFGDASEKGYGACLYVRSRNESGEWQCNLLCAKSKVAPLKRQTIPRLELCAALLLAELFEKVKQSLTEISFDKVQLWSDSEITLFRIRSTPNKYATFVANRVSQIQDVAPPNLWSHILTNLNPADLVSRGIMPSELECSSLWWHGPHFLSLDDRDWPTWQTQFENIEDSEVVESKICLNVVNSDPKLYEKYSNLNKLLRISALCLRFIKNGRLPEDARLVGELAVSELDMALKGLIKYIQKENFSSEIKQLKANGHLKKNNKLSKLSPFLDDQDILRVGGRLGNSELPEDHKHPMLLPSNHVFCRLLVRNKHLKSMHVGPQGLLSFIRQEFWILGARQLCKDIVHECIRCFRTKPTTLQQLMGQLPPERVRMHKAFENTGIDFCGPFLIINKIRSNVVVKCYLCIFVCFSTKATHIEVVQDLSTNAFLSALRRFIGRRGKCANIYTDNATNFVGARKELIQLQKLFDSETHKVEVLRYCSNEGIAFHTIPPRSPHFGGLWEAAVKSAKALLKRELGDNKCTYEELNTLVIQVEACLNSRPLTPMSSDPSDLTALTPGHFLIGGPLNMLPEPSLFHLDFNRLSRYQRFQYSLQKFWRRWSNEYLSELQEKHKWAHPTKNIELGLLVLLKEDNLPPNKWVLGRVTQTHPGSDNLIRVITVKTSTGEFKRAITKICVLPTEFTNPNV